MIDPAIPADVSAKNRRAAPPLRQCALTRQEMPADQLLRFVAGPDGAIAPDLAGKLGGRGVWVTATRAAVGQAVARNVFAKSLKMHAKPPADLADQVERQLRVRVRQALAFANKAGLVTCGFTKVDQAIQSGRAVLLIEAADAAADGAEKLRRKFLAIATAANRPAMLTTLLPIAELSLAIGRPNVVHAALAEGGQCRAFLRECRRLERFHSNELQTAETNDPLPNNTLSDDARLTDVATARSKPVALPAAEVAETDADTGGTRGGGDDGA